MSAAEIAGVLACAAAAFGAMALRSAERASLLSRAGLEASARAGAWPRLLDVRASVAAAIVGGGAVGAALVGPAGAAAGMLAGWGGRLWLRRRKLARDAALLDEQLGDAVRSVAAGLRAGLSLSQAIGFAADEGEPPLAPAMREVVDRAAMGQPLDAALARWADERDGPDGPDVRLVAGALRLHRRTGGDLPRVLDRLAETLAERRGAAREVRSLTAQARLSGSVLGFLPVGFFLFLSVTSREDIAAAYRSSLGSTAIVLGLVMQGAAFLWIRRLLRVE